MTSDLSPDSQRALRRMLLERQSSGRVPGLYGGVVRDGRLLWGAGVGSADPVEAAGVPPTEDSQFLIASISKTFTAVLIMALRDEGRLDLDDTVETHVPESSHHGITIRQMLSHTTGMQREPVGDVWEHLTFPDRTRLVEGWNGAEKILRPHHQWHYSNLVFSMLGEIVARLDGREWSESLQARILDPLGMTRTSVGITHDAVAGFYVPPYTDVPVPEPLLDIDSLAPAGGLASTARDLATWASFLSDPTDEVLTADTVEEMCRPQSMSDLRGWRAAWGLGLMLVRTDKRIYVGHPGAMPGHISGLFVDRATRTGAVVLMNSTSAPDPVEFATDLAAYVIDNDPVEPELWTPGVEVPDELTGLLGQWFSEGRGFDFSVRRGRLEARLQGAPPGLPPSVFVRLEEDLYRTESGRETGELLRITRGAEGRPMKLNWASYLFTREPYAFGQWKATDA